ncbi:MAG TPA: N-acetylmuramidase domain-containing protein [Kaistiaceae bacterium]|nr:N-acetylmuramidase domain-containing protein [Kaistiaceae bacterium]
MSIIDQLEAGGGKRGRGGIVARAAARIGCDPLYLQAILNVESGGDAFDKKGRLIILPEKHVFWRELPAALRAKARALGLATPKWARSNYAGLGGKGSDRRWTRLRRMVELHETAALMSASYGKPQIMGFNHKLAGYSSVTEFVLALAENSDAHDVAFIAFLEAVGLADELRAKDSPAIARRYNGSGQVARYAGMIDAEYRKLLARSEKRAVRKGDLPTVTTVVGVPGRSAMLRLGSEGYKVKALQERLVALGYHVVVDGDFGPATRRAVVAFQADHGLAVDGIVGPETEALLDKAVPINDQPGNSRDGLTVADLRNRGSQTIKQADRLTIGGVVALLFGSVGEAGSIKDAGWLSFATDALGKVKDFAAPALDLVGAHPGLAVAIAAAGVVYVAWRIKGRRLSDAREWRHVG